MNYQMNLSLLIYEGSFELQIHTTGYSGSFLSRSIMGVEHNGYSPYNHSMMFSLRLIITLSPVFNRKLWSFVLPFTYNLPFTDQTHMLLIWLNLSVWFRRSAVATPIMKLLFVASITSMSKLCQLQICSFAKIG